MNQYEMQDPRTQYPAPKFNKQPQAAPGDVHKMDPEPDHGETSYVGSDRLKGRKALITGGDSGIGRATAIAYAREGADVAISYLPEEEDNAREVIKLIQTEGRLSVALPGDVKDEAYCNELVATAHEKLGGLDIIVSNAGKQVAVEDIQDISTEQFDDTYKTNVYAPFWIIKKAVPLLKPGAAIIVTSSIQAYDPSPNLVDYAGTKAAEKAMVQALGPQLIEKGIRINAVAPGPIWTPLQPSGGQPQESVETFGEQVPIKRPGQPAELAPVFVFLASQESSYVIGETYGVTGGAPTA